MSLNMGPEWIGWASSVVLLLTIGAQIRKQQREKTSKGVSKWLFVGQVGAELGFIAYSVILENWVFAVTNALLLIENCIGLAVTLSMRATPSFQTNDFVQAKS